jgi:hypothetical protein
MGAKETKETGTVLKRDQNAIPIQNSGKSSHYQASPAANVKVKESAGFLESVIIGAFTASGILEISDSATDGDGDIKIKITGEATDTGQFPKTIPINLDMEVGICADIAEFVDVTFIYR